MSRLPDLWVEVTLEIEAPAERVWAVMTDVERWHEWTASITNIRRLDDGPFQIGSRARVKQPRFPALVWRVTAIEPGRSFEWETRSIGVRTLGQHRVEPVGSGRSFVALTVLSNGWFIRLLRRRMEAITREYVEMEAAGLKRRCERAT